MEIKLVSVPAGEDKDKYIKINDVIVPGCVYWGWLRSGGEQWVYDGPAGLFGAKSLKDIKREIARRAA